MGIKIITPPSAEPAPNFSGIYAIRCVANGRVYVGSAVMIAKRWRSHRSDLNKGKHHNSPMQRAWDKYGAAQFRFEVLLACVADDLLREEQRFIDGLRSADRRHGFNLNPIAGSNLGRKFGEAARARMAEAAKRRPPPTQEARRSASARMVGNSYALGYRHTDETLSKLSAISKARYKPFDKPFDAAAREAISQRFKGRPLDSGHREKIASALRGKQKSDEHRKRIAQAQRLFDATQVDAMKSLITAGASYKKVAEQFRCSAQTAWNAVNGKGGY